MNRLPEAVQCVAGAGVREFRKSVLVVEDHPRQLLAIRKVLAGLGLEMFAAGDGEAAKEYLAHFVPDLVCLELRLPDTSGYELCELIRSSPVHCDVPVVLLSDHAYPEQRAQAYEVGVDDFLVKPIHDEQLRTRVARLLKRPVRRGRARAVGQP